MGEEKATQCSLFLELIFTVSLQTSSWPSSPPCRQHGRFEQDGWQQQRKTLRWRGQPASPKSSKRSVMASSPTKVTTLTPKSFPQLSVKTCHSPSHETPKTENDWPIRARDLGGLLHSSFCQSVEFTGLVLVFGSVDKIYSLDLCQSLVFIRILP